MSSARPEPQGRPAPSRLRRYAPFLAWLGLFYAAWAALVIAGALWPVVAAHWPIAAAMAAGSYVAGSTPMGGGTIGFPILVLAFDQPAALGRDFSFAVQSIGMTSAAIFILCRRQALEWPMLRAALLGSLLGTPLGIVFIAPHAPELFIKLLFAVIWGSFGILHFQRARELTRHVGITPTQPAFDARVGFAIGLLGGATVASITGVGIDMLLYTVLVLLVHADLRIAIASSVVLMAFTSVVGIATKLVLGDVQPGVWAHWLAAAPVVALGAPLGALIVAYIGRVLTLRIVAALCVLQLAWTLQHEWDALGPWSLAAVALGLGLFLLAFRELHDLGERLARRQRRREG